MEPSRNTERNHFLGFLGLKKKCFPLIFWLQKKETVHHSMVTIYNNIYLWFYLFILFPTFFFVLFFLIFNFFILFFCLCAFADLQIEGEYPVFRMAENYGKTVQECQRFFLFLFIFLYAHFAKKF
jgi:hypothetical protein